MTWHRNLDSQLNPKQEKLNRKWFWLWLAQHCSLDRKLLSLIGYFACKPVEDRHIDHNMAQGSFASRIFHKYCKNSQEPRGADSELPHVSEFTIMWEKLSKFTVFPLNIKYVGLLLQLRTVFVCTRIYWQKINSLSFLYLKHFHLAKCSDAVFNTFIKASKLWSAAHLHNLKVLFLSSFPIQSLGLYTVCFLHVHHFNTSTPSLVDFCMCFWSVSISFICVFGVMPTCLISYVVNIKSSYLCVSVSNGLTVLSAPDNFLSFLCVLHRIHLTLKCSHFMIFINVSLPLFSSPSFPSMRVNVPAKPWWTVETFGTPSSSMSLPKSQRWRLSSSVYMPLCLTWNTIDRRRSPHV